MASIFFMEVVKGGGRGGGRGGEGGEGREGGERIGWGVLESWNYSKKSN